MDHVWHPSGSGGWSAPWPTQRPTGAEPDGQVPAQRSSSLHVERLVDLSRVTPTSPAPRRSPPAAGARSARDCARLRDDPAPRFAAGRCRPAWRSWVGRRWHRHVFGPGSADTLAPRPRSHGPGRRVDTHGGTGSRNAAAARAAPSRDTVRSPQQSAGSRGSWRLPRRSPRAPRTSTEGCEQALRARPVASRQPRRTSYIPDAQTRQLPAKHPQSNRPSRSPTRIDASDHGGHPTQPYRLPELGVLR